MMIARSREAAARHVAGICAALALGSVAVPPAFAGPTGVDVWPTLQGALRAAAAGPLEHLDQLPDLRRRCCVLRPVNAASKTADVPALLRLVFAEWGFTCQDAQPDGERPLPIVRWELRPLGNDGTVRVEVVGGPTGFARYRDVPWAAATAKAVSRRGAFTLVVGRSGWESDVRSAAQDALKDAVRMLVSLESQGRNAEADISAFEARIRARLPDASREDFHQTRQMTTTRLHRVSSRFVLPTEALHPSAESRPERERWHLVVGVAVAVAVVTVLAAAIWRRLRFVERTNGRSAGAG